MSILFAVLLGLGEIVSVGGHPYRGDPLNHVRTVYLKLERGFLLSTEDIGVKYGATTIDRKIAVHDRVDNMGWGCTLCSQLDLSWVTRMKYQLGFVVGGGLTWHGGIPYPPRFPRAQSIGKYATPSRRTSIVMYQKDDGNWLSWHKLKAIGMGPDVGALFPHRSLPSLSQSPNKQTGSHPAQQQSPQSVLSGIAGSIRSFPLGAKVGIMMIFSIFAALILGDGLNRFRDGRSYRIGSLLRIGAAILLYGIIALLWGVGGSVFLAA